ncbi:MAG: PadR family transcriptional regulator [Dehalococcoidia bacterium]
MRRKANTLVPFERQLLMAALAFMESGQPEFHGYAIARDVADAAEAKRLVGHGTLYRALDRLEEFGMLASRLEDADAAAAASRPRRRLYQLTAQGETAAQAARAAESPESPQHSLRPGWAPQ